MMTRACSSWRERGCQGIQAGSRHGPQGVAGRPGKGGGRGGSSQPAPFQLLTFNTDYTTDWRPLQADRVGHQQGEVPRMELTT
jgi:hypothetical protein